MKLRDLKECIDRAFEIDPTWLDVDVFLQQGDELVPTGVAFRTELLATGMTRREMLASGRGREVPRKREVVFFRSPEEAPQGSKLSST